LARWYGPLGVCGADGLLIEVHPTPETDQSDGLRSLKLTMFQQLMDELRPSTSPSAAGCIGLTLPCPTRPILYRS